MEFNPVVCAYSVVSEAETVLFIDEKKLGKDVQEVRVSSLPPSLSPSLPACPPYHSHSLLIPFPSLPPSLP